MKLTEPCENAGFFIELHQQVRFIHHEHQMIHVALSAGVMLPNLVDQPGNPHGLTAQLGTERIFTVAIQTANREPPPP